jgi:hypothetical protein
MIGQNKIETRVRQIFWKNKWRMMEKEGAHSIAAQKKFNMARFRKVTCHDFRAIFNREEREN